MTEKEFARAVADAVEETYYTIAQYIKEDKSVLDRTSFENTIENIKASDKTKGNVVKKVMVEPLAITDRFITDVYRKWFNEKYGR